SLTHLLPRLPRPRPFPYTTLFRSAYYRRVRRDPGSGAMTAGGEELYLFDALAWRLGRRQPGQHEGAHRGRMRGSGDSFADIAPRSEEHTSELQSRFDLVCRLLLAK